MKPAWLFAALGLVFLLTASLLIWLFWVSFTVGVSDRMRVTVALLASAGVALGVRGIGFLADRSPSDPSDPPAA